MMLCRFASANDDALTIFFAIDDDEPLPQYIIAHRKSSLLLLKILTPPHLMDLKSMRTSPDINSDIQNLCNPHQTSILTMVVHEKAAHRNRWSLLAGKPGARKPKRKKQR